MKYAHAQTAGIGIAERAEGERRMDANYMNMGDNPESQRIHTDMVKWRLSSDDILLELYNELLGNAWDEGKGDFVPSGVKLMNVEGARAISSICRMAINKSSMLSKLSYNDIMIICKMEANTIARAIFLNWEKWEIKKQYAETILIMCREFIFMSLMRAEGEGERLALGRTERINRVYGVQGNKRTPFLFGRNKEEEA